MGVRPMGCPDPPNPMSMQDLGLMRTCERSSSPPWSKPARACVRSRIGSACTECGVTFHHAECNNLEAPFVPLIGQQCPPKRTLTTKVDTVLEIEDT